jgi:GTP-binding protein
MSTDFSQIRFHMGAHSLKQLPPDTGREVAVAGRSNAGKSSAINAITGRRNLARTSKSPGRTQQINFFDIDPDRRLVDLPGYGFARVSQAQQRHWQQTLPRYLQRRSLQGLLMIMDSRRPLTELDRQMLDWSLQTGIPVHILLTKADKLSRAQAGQALKQVEAALVESPVPVTVQLFSARKPLGVDEARKRLLRWLAGKG